MRKATIRVGFSKSDPIKIWKGYHNVVDVFVDGKKIGELIGRGAHLVHIEYYFAGDHPLRREWPSLDMPVGIRHAKMLAKGLLLTLESNKRKPDGAASEN